MPLYSSTLRTGFDRDLFASMLRNVNAEHLDDEVLTMYIRSLRRRRWSYKLIGEALQVSPNRVSQLHRDWQDKTFP